MENGGKARREGVREELSASGCPSNKDVGVVGPLLNRRPVCFSRSAIAETLARCPKKQTLK